MANQSANDPQAVIDLSGPPDHVKELVFKVVKEKLYHLHGAVKDDSVKNTIEYSHTCITLDHTMKPRVMHPAFWTFDAPRVPMITIEAPADGWNHHWTFYSEVLVTEVLEPNNLADCVVRFYHPDGSQDRLYIPKLVSVKGKWAYWNSPTAEHLLEERKKAFQKQLDKEKNKEKRLWLEWTLNEISKTLS
ncbi:hypothetical protein HD806DRAFT_552429 [Xylariaceae sp. AK1471]|nr:hypothetical protein HD806DRAFT_552429 [Xylariaceae sp. AK1471]